MEDETPSRKATASDLYEVEGQAESIGGRIVRLPGHGILISRIVARIARSLHEYQVRVGQVRVGIGEVHTLALGYVVPMLTSGRESLCADVSYSIGPFPENPMAFLEGTTLAVEIRDEMDYGPETEFVLAARRRDYFETGTLVVWDVDPVAGLIHAHRPGDPPRPTTFGRGQIANADPAVLGWTIAVDTIFG